ncbi:CDP-alcohol phosphatidyltransferase family protein [Gangjinia marincola]|uniref:CDP-alcohol phosphatidyltransferase family protein n=1 Tax=Gangjinia marincola TaxID=578463 RepID=A0ABN1MDP7_9FLAO
MSLKKQIPNIITLLNLLCGCIGVLFAVEGNLIMAAVFVGGGIFFDFFDGLAARKLNVQSELGLQLDSLADMVTSGLVPGIAMFKLLQRSFGNTAEASWDGGFFEFDFHPVALIGFVITLASAYRLANFNVDDRQDTSFIGLPTPANALLVLSIPMIITYQQNPLITQVLLNPYFLIGFSVLSAYLLNAELPLFALKFKDWSVKKNALRYSFIAISAILLVLLKYLALPVIMLLYILLSLIFKEQSQSAS